MSSMSSSQKKKVTLYFNAGMLAETQKEALRQDRSVSWIIQAAWRLAREEIRQAPGAVTGSVTSSGEKDPLESQPTPPPLPVSSPVSRPV
jgi:uncharacterized small protein (TIGR04563 family)